jgi:hypothetical protein
MCPVFVPLVVCYESSATNLGLFGGEKHLGHAVGCHPLAVRENVGVATSHVDSGVAQHRASGGQIDVGEQQGGGCGVP